MWCDPEEAIGVIGHADGLARGEATRWGLAARVERRQQRVRLSEEEQWCGEEVRTSPVGGTEGAWG
eukprot:scaffold19060_cov33-Tisochrysis_lutea.AAC.2